MTTTLVRPARPDDLAGLPALEEASDALFARHGVGPLPPVTTTAADLAEAEQVLVAEDASGLVGFARLEVVDGQAHLEQLSVPPDATGRGVGTALLEASAAWAARAGHEALTLCTFADVPWNGPFYARRGFETLTELTPGLRMLRETERRLGLDAAGRRVVMRRGVGPWALLEDLTRGLVNALGDDLVGLWVHGSLVAGDFTPARSDIDVLTALRHAPDDATLATVAPVHAGVEARHPAWVGRVEVETVGTPTVEALVGGAEPTAGATIMRISPGEALHLLPATSHRVLTWATVRERGQALVGPAAGDVLPAVPAGQLRAALLAHVRDWPTWVEDMRPVGAQSYAVLSICRAWCALVEGEQLSKRAAAERFSVTHPSDAPLAGWAREWWYAGGSDEDPGRFEQVRDLVVRTSRTILDAAADA